MLYCVTFSFHTDLGFFQHCNRFTEEDFYPCPPAPVCGPFKRFIVSRESQSKSTKFILSQQSIHLSTCQVMGSAHLPCIPLVNVIPAMLFNYFSLPTVTLYGQKHWAAYKLHLQELLRHGNPYNFCADVNARGGLERWSYWVRALVTFTRSTPQHFTWFAPLLWFLNAFALQ